MSSQDPDEVQPLIHDEFYQDIIDDGDFETFPELKEALEFADTTITPDLPDDGENLDPQLSDSQRRASLYVRRVLRAIRDTEEFKRARALLPEDVRQKLDDFLDGKRLSEILPSDPPEFIEQHPEAANDASAPTGAPALEEFSELSHELSSVKLSDETECMVAQRLRFQNWGQTVNNVPEWTAVPEKIGTVTSLVKHAKQNNKRIRASGYRHTWGDMYSEDGHYLISMLGIRRVTQLPDFSPIFYPWREHELNKIELKEVSTDTGPVAYVQLGAGVTNEGFRRWAIHPERGASRWTLPLQVILVENSFGGTNAPICHGAGIRTKTLSDLVTEIQYVDANGILREVSDPSLLKAAAGCFGLLGIVTRITLKLDQMTAAMFNPRFEDLILAIPPPEGYNMRQFGPRIWARFQTLRPRLPQARRDFIENAENRYYSEWFWFPYQQNVFVNAWDNSTDTKGMVNYPDKHEVFIQWLSHWAGNVLNKTPAFTNLRPRAQAAIMGSSAMVMLPKRRVKTQLINALHFIRGIHNMRVGCFEVNLPIPANERSDSGTNTPTRNWTVVQRAWWDALAAMFRENRTVPARIALEMRVTGDSCVIMAPQGGNSLGTASIEVITSMPAVRDDGGQRWRSFKQVLADIWLNYRDANGETLRARPHYAKEWTDIKVGDVDWVQSLRQRHKEEIEEFKKVLAQIGEQHGWTLKDLETRFSNPLFDRLIFGKP